MAGKSTASRCICDWPAADDCDGLGVLTCEGCGGDQCVCRCGGTRDCPGCAACEDVDDGDDGEDLAEEDELDHLGDDDDDEDP